MNRYWCPIRGSQVVTVGEGDRAIHGLVIGKFMPVHNGHRYLIDTALAHVARLTVVVCSSPGEPIPGTLRYQWMQVLYPQVHVVHLIREASWSPRGHPACYDRWAQSLHCIHPDPIDVVFGSEEYIEPLAARLGARAVIVDRARVTVPISAAAIRANPRAHWSYIPEVVRPYFLMASGAGHPAGHAPQPSKPATVLGQPLLAHGEVRHDAL